MNHYLVKSGELEQVVVAADSNAAALWLMQSVMDQSCPSVIPDDNSPDPFLWVENGLQHLGESISVHRCDQAHYSESFDTLEILTEWKELVQAVCKMEKILSRGGSTLESIH